METNNRTGQGRRGRLVGVNRMWKEMKGVRLFKKSGMTAHIGHIGSSVQPYSHVRDMDSDCAIVGLVA